jgi:hypothetical protein
MEIPKMKHSLFKEFQKNNGKWKFTTGGRNCFTAIRLMPMNGAEKTAITAYIFTSLLTCKLPCNTKEPSLF